MKYIETIVSRCEPMSDLRVDCDIFIKLVFFFLDWHYWSVSKSTGSGPATYTHRTGQYTSNVLLNDVMMKLITEN